MSFFSFGLPHELFGWNDAVSELDEIRTLYVYPKTINHFVITVGVISAIRDYLGLKMLFFGFGLPRTLRVE